MCKRYSFRFDRSFFQRYQTSNGLRFEVRYNVAPSQSMPVVVRHSLNTVELMRWGFVPPWEHQKMKPKALINLRDDTVINTAWAHKYLQFQRCLIPATGFFEWQKTAIGRKIPYYIFVKDTKYFSFAGFYNSYIHPKTGKSFNTYAILTTSPNALMEQIHQRMPVILAQEDEDAWLNPDFVEIEHLKPFLKPYPAGKMAAHPVSTRVNFPSNDDQGLLKPGKKSTAHAA
jgi:putative SOS response-associated peptidase YedK